MKAWSAKHPVTVPCTAVPRPMVCCVERPIRVCFLVPCIAIKLVWWVPALTASITQTFAPAYSVEVLASGYRLDCAVRVMGKLGELLTHPDELVPMVRRALALLLSLSCCRSPPSVQGPDARSPIPLRRTPAPPAAGSRTPSHIIEPPPMRAGIHVSCSPPCQAAAQGAGAGLLLRHAEPRVPQVGGHLALFRSPPCVLLMDRSLRWYPMSVLITSFNCLC